ncbi:hypothetical protein GETHLI_26370 [Geothrix limicola]|uniref:eCIS core domain-containing protein n=1 Tax=Geothrix limicola TaxID=2927978 RepID=A0ABQ5QIX0_9BACT|nr:DUF4157 domain-containing protein [Geothrix limicola]GLH74135.1 hypothetical protein GETHLI_26370 [Geothrix limicola]
MNGKTVLGAPPGKVLSKRPPMGSLLQRQCACGTHQPGGGECMECARKKRVQRKGNDALRGAPAWPLVQRALAGPSQPLDSATRAFMGPRFGHDFSKVRVHTDAPAAESAQALRAKAYTVGPQIVFGPGQYQPTTPAGRQLLAHELAHTIQQGDQAAAPSMATEVSQPDDPLEVEADRAAARALASPQGAPSGVQPPVIQRPGAVALKVQRSVTDEALGAHADQRESAARGDAAVEGRSGAAIPQNADPAAAPGSAQAPGTTPGASSVTTFPICFAPSVFFNPVVAAGFGLLAEKLIEKDYCSKMGCKAGENYFDPSLGGPDPRYAAFIIRNNPGLSRTHRAILRASPMRRPDILTHTPSRQDYYEIKPDSIYGTISGLEKLIEIGAIMSVFSLPYVAGTTYTPSPKIPLVGFSVGGVPVEAFLSVKRGRAGLVQYEVCLRTNWALVALAAAIAALIIILIILIGEEGGIPLPIPDPGDPDRVPAPLPSPNPVPSPIPPRTPSPVPAVVGGAGGSAGKENPAPGASSGGPSATPGTASSGPSATQVTPRPYTGTIDGSFHFNYVSGLPPTPAPGTTYPVTISFQSHGKSCVAVVPFMVDAVAAGMVDLHSTNASPLDVAPEGDQPPLIIRPNNPARLPLARLGGTRP